MTDPSTPNPDSLLSKRASFGSEDRSDIPDRLIERMLELNEDALRLRKRELLFRNLKFGLVGGFFLLTTLWWMMSFQEVSRKLEIEGPYVSQIQINGEISPGGPISADALYPQLLAAFKDENAKGVLLTINSPGGTPVQAGLIHDRILFLKEKYKKKVIVVAGDVVASGGYMIAVAGDKIYADGSTIVGSIGVVMRGFGFTNIMKTVGIERRVLTAGENKAEGDPFLPQTNEERSKFRAILEAMHSQFIAKVRAGRGSRLAAPDEILFNADVWTGERALSLGLIDGLKDAPSVLRDEFDVEEVKDYSTQDFLTKLSRRFGVLVRSSMDWRID